MNLCFDRLARKRKGGVPSTTNKRHKTTQNTSNGSSEEKKLNVNEKQPSDHTHNDAEKKNDGEKNDEEKKNEGEIDVLSGDLKWMLRVGGTKSDLIEMARNLFPECPELRSSTMTRDDLDGFLTQRHVEILGSKQLTRILVAATKRARASNREKRRRCAEAKIELDYYREIERMDNWNVIETVRCALGWASPHHQAAKEADAECSVESLRRSKPQFLPPPIWDLYQTGGMDVVLELIHGWTSPRCRRSAVEKRDYIPVTIMESRERVVWHGHRNNHVPTLRFEVRVQIHMTQDQQWLFDVLDRRVLSGFDTATGILSLEMGRNTQVPYISNRWNPTKHTDFNRNIFYDTFFSCDSQSRDMGELRLLITESFRFATFKSLANAIHPYLSPPVVALVDSYLWPSSPIITQLAPAIDEQATLQLMASCANGTTSSIELPPPLHPTRSSTSSLVVKDPFSEDSFELLSSVATHPIIPSPASIEAFIENVLI